MSAKDEKVERERERFAEAGQAASFSCSLAASD